MAGRCRVSASFRRADERALHVRKATRAEPEQLAIYSAFNLDSTPKGVCKMIVYSTDNGRYFLSTTSNFSLSVALFHKPLLEKHPQPHFSQLSKDTASHKAHASINNRYTIKGTDITVAVGKVDKLLS